MSLGAKRLKKTRTAKCLLDLRAERSFVPVIKLVTETKLKSSVETPTTFHP